jgi:hypothetical protein
MSMALDLRWVQKELATEDAQELSVTSKVEVWGYPRS